MAEEKSGGMPVREAGSLSFPPEPVSPRESGLEKFASRQASQRDIPVRQLRPVDG